MQKTLAALTQTVADLAGIVKAELPPPPPAHSDLGGDRGYKIVYDTSERPGKPYKVLDENGNIGAVARDPENARNLMQRLIATRQRNQPGWK